jgi:hypothetical protein
MRLAEHSPVSTGTSASEVDRCSTYHIGFQSHYVTVTSRVPQVSQKLVSGVAPMFQCAPLGIQAGCFDVMISSDGVVIRDACSASSMHFCNWRAAAQALQHSIVKCLIDARQDLLWMHAGVVASAGQAIIVSGPSGQGKSTIVAELLARGWTYLSDEIAPIDPVTARVLPFPLSPYKRISGPGGMSSAEVLQLDKVRVDLEKQVIGRVGHPIKRIYFLSYSPEPALTQVVGCRPGAAVIEMLRNSLNPAQGRDEEIARLCDLTARVPSAWLYYSDAKAAVKQMTLPTRLELMSI